jgi:hypothetical protein
VLLLGGASFSDADMRWHFFGDVWLNRDADSAASAWEPVALEAGWSPRCGFQAVHLEHSAAGEVVVFGGRSGNFAASGVSPLRLHDDVWSRWETLQLRCNTLTTLWGSDQSSEWKQWRQVPRKAGSARWLPRAYFQAVAVPPMADNDYDPVLLLGGSDPDGSGGAWR